MKNNYRILSLLLVPVLATAMLAGCGSSSSTGVSAQTQLSPAAVDANSDDTAADADLVSDADWSVDSADTILASILSSDLTDSKVVLDVPEILQNPELPTGCESVALTIALNSLGCDLQKTEIAENYLEYGDNLAYQYAGDPHTESGAGVFAGGIVNAAEKYIKEKNLDIAAINTSGTSLSDLCKVVAAGYPVVIWGTMYMSDPLITSQSYEYDGYTYTWYQNEHCMVLAGYDQDAGTVVISDPLSGIVVRDANAYESYFNETGMYSVVLMNKNGVKKTDLDTSKSDSDSKGSSGSDAPDNIDDIISSRQNTSDYYYNQYQSYGNQPGGTWYETSPAVSGGTSTYDGSSSSGGSSSGSSANSQNASDSGNQQSSGSGDSGQTASPSGGNSGTNTGTGDGVSGETGSGVTAGTAGSAGTDGGATAGAGSGAAAETGGGASAETGGGASEGTGATESTGGADYSAPSQDASATTGNAAGGESGS